MTRFLPQLFVAACGGTAPLVDGSPVTDIAFDDASSSDGLVGRDPAADGDFVVTTSTTSIPGSQSGRTMPATLFTSNAPAPHPAVLIAPGFQMDRAQYQSYARHLASWGFVVALVDYADRSIFADHAKLAADLRAALDWMHANTALAIDPARTATAGHSLGGKLAVFAASLDPRVRAVVAWDPVDSTNPSVAPEKMVGMSAAVAVVGELTNASGGGMPCAPAAENFEMFYAGASSPAIRITVANADHMDWVDDPWCGFCGFCAAGSASNEVARTVSRRVDVAWLRRQLEGDLTMDSWLDTPPELATGAVVVSRK